MKYSLITGGTGFLGSALALELLRYTDTSVILLGRAAATEDPTARALRVLTEAASDYGLPPRFVDQNRARIFVEEGDITDPDLHVPAVDIANVWHCAASLRYLDRHRESIYAVNVAGTRNLLNALRRSNIGTFHYISTAYVSGRNTGKIPEALAPDTTATNNVYESSKIEAENLVAAETSMHTRIWRPSIVVGHSHTMATRSDFGVYGFHTQLLRFTRLMQRYWPGDHSIPLRVLADRYTPINLVPIDQVVRQTVTLTARGVAEPVVHLTNQTPPTVGQVMDILFDELGLTPPDYVDNYEDLRDRDRRLNKGLDFYRSYISGHKEFLQSAAATVSTPLRCTFSEWNIRRMFRAAQPSAINPRPVPATTTVARS